MTIELWALLGTTTILFISIFAQQITMDRVYGTAHALSNRDTTPDQRSTTVDRLTRLVRNHVEGMTVFAPLVIIASLADVSNGITQTAAMVIAGARLLHFVFYILAITPFRSLVWGVGFLLATPAFVYGLISGLPV